MRKTKTSTLFGRTYRITQLSAAEAFDHMYGADDFMAFISTASVRVDTAFVPLDCAANIDQHVKDALGVMQPRLVLSALHSAVYDYNFGFLEKRKALKVPKHLRSNIDVEVRSLENESPILSTLVAEGKATLRELQEFYSLEDAFLIYDVLFIEKLNTAEAHHAASQQRRSKA